MCCVIHSSCTQPSPLPYLTVTVTVTSSHLTVKSLFGCWFCPSILSIVKTPCSSCELMSAVTMPHSHERISWFTTPFPGCFLSLGKGDASDPKQMNFNKLPNLYRWHFSWDYFPFNFYHIIPLTFWWHLSSPEFISIYLFKTWNIPGERHTIPTQSHINLSCIVPIFKSDLLRGAKKIFLPLLVCFKFTLKNKFVAGIPMSYPLKQKIKNFLSEWLEMILRLSTVPGKVWRSKQLLQKC